MRFYVFNTLVGALSIATISAAESSMYGGDTCAPSITTVFLTAPASTVTVHEASSTSTVYLTANPSESIIAVSEVGQQSSISTTTRHSTFTAAEISQGTVSSGALTSTITQTAIFTVPYVEATVTATSPAPATISFYVVSGSTVYLDGQTPVASDTYVILPSAVTVTVEPEETTTVQSHATLQSTLTETVQFSSLTIAGSSFTGIGSGGWNKTTSAFGGPTGTIGTTYKADPTTLSAQAGFGAYSSLTLASDSSLYIWSTYPAASLSTLSAASGFDMTATANTDGAATSTFDPYIFYTTSSPCPESNTNSFIAPYPNSTVSTILSPGLSTAASGGFHSSSGSFSTVYTSASLGTAASSSGVNTTGSFSSPFTYAPLGTTASSSGASATSRMPVITGTTISSSSNANPSTIAPSTTSVPANSSNSILTNTSSTQAASPSATACGLTGDFTMNFDDIPPLATGNLSNSNDADPEPVFNPYHQFDFSDGFVVVPPPTDPYLPSSPPLLVEFVPNFNSNGSNPSAGPNTQEFGFSGEIADGDNGLTGCFSFNFYGANFGCDSRGPDCVFTFTGIRYDNATHQQVEVTSQTLSIPACPPLIQCTLSPITVDPSFNDLTAIRMNVTVGSQPKIWWMDDLRLGWSDNSCAKGLCRQSSHVH